MPLCAPGWQGPSWAPGGYGFQPGRVPVRATVPGRLTLLRAWHSHRGCLSSLISQGVLPYVAHVPRSRRAAGVQWVELLLR